MVTPLGHYATGSRLALGWEIANYMRSNAPSLGITYVIWDNKIWTAGSTHWKTYCNTTKCRYGSRPNATQLHGDHVHISVRG